MSAQDIPGFEIWMMYIAGNEQNGYVYSEPWNVSNAAGYDNQPSFSADGKTILFSSMRDGIQTDVYAYSTPSGPLEQVTKTKESEYSPEFMPGGKYITAVTVEADEAQRIWKCRIDGRKRKVLMRDQYNVGYYCALPNMHYAMFVLPEPFTLQYVQAKEQGSLVLDKKIGRSIKKVPGASAFIYLNKADSSGWIIKQYNYDTRNLERVCTIAPVAEDLCFGPDANIYMAYGSKIYYFDYRKTNKWYLMMDLQTFGIEEIYRLAFSPDGQYLTFVASE